ncbi:DUF1127 domain-containing protein [Pelagibius litoralis]|uniref:DUF1127 domain-containing protein n=1 Tax=Pelagibius litoralis TaxID=374515 RepID=A0A967EZU3_9PROT|nr:DUF1127 domain-containing protein [Pelagibius litoralis]NIA70481.1 DUF1127 domain-containing protein [Pelagibius litoralis]
MHTISKPPVPLGRLDRRESPIRRRFGALPGVWLLGILDLLATWQERSSDRSRLAGMDDRQLGDIALSRADLEPEIRKPFWRA